MVQGLATKASITWEMLEVQHLRSDPRPADLKPLRVGPAICVLTCPPGNSDAYPFLTTIHL